MVYFTYRVGRTRYARAALPSVSRLRFGLRRRGRGARPTSPLPAISSVDAWDGSDAVAPTEIEEEFDLSELDDEL